MNGQSPDPAARAGITAGGGRAPQPPRRRTRAEQRAASRLALLDATTECLVERHRDHAVPGPTDDPRFPALLDAAIALIRGLVMEIPIWGHQTVTARWEAIKPILSDAAAQLLD